MIFFNKDRKSAEQTEAHAEFKREALAHMEPLYRTALYMTRNPERAQDLVQETYLKAHRFWHRYEPGTNCKAWLFRILTNTFITILYLTSILIYKPIPSMVILTLLILVTVITNKLVVVQQKLGKYCQIRF